MVRCPRARAAAHEHRTVSGDVTRRRVQAGLGEIFCSRSLAPRNLLTFPMTKSLGSFIRLLIVRSETHSPSAERYQLMPHGKRAQGPRFEMGGCPLPRRRGARRVRSGIGV